MSVAYAELGMVAEREPSESLLNSDSLGHRTNIPAQDRLSQWISVLRTLTGKNPVLRQMGRLVPKLRPSLSSELDYCRQ